MAQELCALLESRGVRCWIAPRNIDPGAEYADEIVRGIRSCDALILVATPAAIASNNVLNELEQAHKADKTIFTVMVGKPQITPRFDYYIARLHWIESANGAMGDVATRLADVMTGHKAWPDVATPPSLGRRLSYDRRAFWGSLVACLLTLALAAGIVWSYMAHRQHQQALDYRSLGWVSFARLPLDHAEPASQGASVQMQVWIGDEKTPMGAIKLSATTRSDDGRTNRKDLSKALDPDATVNALVEYMLPPATRHVTTCLTVPSSQLRRSYTVVQDFGAVITPDGATLTDHGAPRVLRADDPAGLQSCS